MKSKEAHTSFKNPNDIQGVWNVSRDLRPSLPPIGGIEVVQDDPYITILE